MRSRFASIATLIALVLPTSWARAAPPTVTLAVDGTFDDAATSAQPLLDDAGLHASFFVNSALVGTSGHLNLAQLSSLQDGGNEVGGSTTTELDLLTVDSKEQAREICVGRSWLLQQGLDVRSFGFPDSFGDVLQSGAPLLVAQCGYSAAIGRYGIGCDRCPNAVSLPVADPFRLATRLPVSSSTQLATLEGWLGAIPRPDGGLVESPDGGLEDGWVILVIDHVCEDCDPSSISPANLHEFLGWLAVEQAAGLLTVKTVGEVVGVAGSPPQPAVAGPDPTGPGPDGNLLQNGSLEQYTPPDGGIPDCWAISNKGTNTGLASRVGGTDAHDGQSAQQIIVTDYGDGDWRLMTARDLGDCAPAAIPGHQYRVSAWVEPYGVAKFVAYYRDGSGTWSYWAESRSLPVTSDYELQSWVTPPVPDKAVGLSVGVSLESKGSLTADQFKLEDLGVAPPVGCATEPGSATDAWCLIVAPLLVLIRRRRGLRLVCGTLDWPGPSKGVGRRFDDDGADVKQSRDTNSVARRTPSETVSTILREVENNVSGRPGEQ